MRPRWQVVSALGVVQVFAWGSSYYLMAVLAEPVVRDTGWSLAWVVGSLSAGLLVAGLVSPSVGRTIGRRGGRSIMAGGCVATAAGLLVLAAAPTLPVFVLGWTVIGVGMGATLYDPAFATLGTIYGREARSAVTTLTLWGGFASTVCWPLSAFLVASVGWRGACIAYAVILVLVCVPLLLTFLPSQVVALVGEGPASEHPAAKLGTRERRAFHFLAAMVTVTGLFVTIVSVHLPTLLQARGATLAEAVQFGALIGPSQVAARLVEMAGRGRHHPIWTMTAAAAFGAAGTILLASGLPVAGLALILYGVGNGIFSIARGALPMTLFGPDRYAAVMGRLARPSLVAQAAAPTIGGLLLASTGADWTLLAVAVLACANILLVAFLWTAVGGLRRVS